MGPHRFSIVVHGGAGPVGADDDAQAAREGCLRGARAGYAVLAAGGSALDAVEVAVAVLEDDPLFNAGTGAALNRDGQVELDASIMSGAGSAGAVAAVRTVKNPVRLARRVMEKTPHLLLAGPGADAFAREQAFVEISPASLVTARARARWEAARRAAGAPSGSGGTVGAVACDSHRHCAAATSTGGTGLKLPGRVGDSAIIGPGTWAQDGVGAASCTGLGEAIWLAGGARHAVGLLAGGANRFDATENAVDRIAARSGSGGIILVDGEGLPAARFDTARMAYAWLTSEGACHVGFLAEDGETNRGSGT